MIAKKVGDTLPHVSSICLGTMTFGNPVGSAEAERLVHWALDHEINFIDTANIYEGYDRRPGSSGGVAENILGEALHDRRSRAVITTKVGSDVGEGVCLKPHHMRQQLESSLSRLQTEYVDIYELHNPDPATPIADSLATMVEFIREGKVRYWGFSNFNTAGIQQVIELCEENIWPYPVVNQSRYNWIYRDIEATQLPVCREFGIAVTPFQPLHGGLLTGKYRRDKPLPENCRALESPWLDEPDSTMYDCLERFEAEASASNLTPSRYAIRWLLDRQGVKSVVAGVTSIDQLKELLGALD